MTRRTIFEDERRLIDWAEGVIPDAHFGETARAIGCEGDGKVRAVVVYDRFSTFNCEMSIASDGTRRWMTKSFLREAFVYPFLQLNLERVTAFTEQSNRAAVSLVQKLGFRPEGMLRRASGRANIIVFGMLRSECHWLPVPRLIGRPTIMERAYG